MRGVSVGVTGLPLQRGARVPDGLVVPPLRKPQPRQGQLRRGEVGLERGRFLRQERDLHHGPAGRADPVVPGIVRAGEVDGIGHRQGCVGLGELGIELNRLLERVIGQP